jgi:predicted TIM-barrel fold metal-dependent hydrolase
MEDLVSEHYAVISVDGHCGADLLDYRPYLDPAFREEFDAWAAKFSLRYGDVVTSSEWAHRNWDSDLRLAETSEDGVVAEVLYPNTYPPFIDMGPLSMQPPATKADYERMWAGCRAHNRWLVDFCAATPGRRAGIALILLNDPEQAVREIRWARAAGLTGGVLLPGIAPGAAIAPLHSADYEPVWAVCEELSMPLNHHPDSAAPPIVLEPRSLAMHIIEVKWFMHRALWHLIFSGAFQRHPGLNLVLAEQGADWIPGVLYTLDYYWERFQLRAAQEARFGGGGVDELPLRPSEYWARNCYTGATFMRPAEVAQREKIGVSQIMWGQDYPHPEATFPWSREALRHTFSDVDPAEVLAMVSTNACRVFGFDATTLGQVADEIGAPTVEEVRTPLDKIPDGATCPAFADADSARAW